MKGIIFDLWNTLAIKDKSISAIIKGHFGIEIEDYTTHYEHAVQLKPWKSMDEMACNFFNYFRLPKSKNNIGFVKETFSGTKSRLFKGAKELISELSPRYKLGLLSNTTPFEVIKKRWELPFDTIGYSFEIGYLKPSFQSFDTISRRLGVGFKDCYFIDDKFKNIKYANKFGMKAIHFTDMDSLREILN